MDKEDRPRSREAGFDRHLVKPVAPGKLERLIREIGGGAETPPAA